MQVNDSSAAATAGAATKEEVRSFGDAPENGARSRSGKRFRSALERKRDDPGTHDGASAAAMAGWFRPESAVAAASRPVAVGGASAARPVDRVLVGSGPDGAEAPIRIGAGAASGDAHHTARGRCGA